MKMEKTQNENWKHALIFKPIIMKSYHTSQNAYLQNIKKQTWQLI